MLPPAQATRLLGRLALGSTLVLTCGCRNLERFELEPGETYCGSMVSAPRFHEGFLPDNVPPALRLRLDLSVDDLQSFPGLISTDDADRGLCSDTGEPLFHNAVLRSIEGVQHDAISNMSIGEGHEQNLLTYVDSTCQGTMLAVVSLIDENHLEARLFKPAPLPPPDAGPELTPGFALFPLKRQPSANCEF